MAKMRPDDLSAKERAVLFALLGEAREVTNLQLAEGAGFRLEGKERRKLNELKLVSSRKTGRTYSHELTDEGWHWCATELSAGLPGKATSMEGALYAILGGLARHLADTGQILADVFRRRSVDEPTSPPRGEEVEKLIIDAYQDLAAEPGEFVRLSELRGRLSFVARPDLDSTLEKMYRAQQVNLIPQSNQQALAEADRQSALRVGGEFKHLLSVR
jgi:hypothetical protein